jgi:hypothetical protein
MTMRTFITVFLALILAVPALAQQPILSPRDSSSIVLNGKKISINYGRPSMRGRTIMGELVPYNKVWRTGANEATTFVTEADLELEGVTLPKGTYTLYTLPSEQQWKLIINKQTGQWGTVYDPGVDFARVPLKRQDGKSPVEKFTISFRKNGSNGGVLVLEWENTVLSIAFTVLNTNSNTSKTRM